MAREDCGRPRREKGMEQKAGWLRTGLGHNRGLRPTQSIRACAGESHLLTTYRPDSLTDEETLRVCTGPQP